jgi:hypothetical protein
VAYTPGSAHGTSTGGPVPAEVDLEAARCVLTAIRDHTLSRHTVRHSHTMGSEVTSLWVVGADSVVSEFHGSYDMACDHVKPRRYTTAPTSTLDACIASGDQQVVIDCLLGGWRAGPDACVVEWAIPCPAGSDGGT